MTINEMRTCRNDVKRCNQIASQIAMCKSNARCGKGVSYGGEPRGKGEDVPSVQRYIERLETYSEEYEAVRAEHKRLAYAIKRFLPKLSAVHRLLIDRYYIQALPWKQINEELSRVIGKGSISESASKRLHAEALKAFAFQVFMDSSPKQT